MQMYEDRVKILRKVGIDITYDPDKLLINSLNTSDRDLPTNNYKDLRLNGGEEIYGWWLGIDRSEHGRAGYL